jgi:hypothetical protein
VTVAIDEPDGDTEKSCPVPLSGTCWGLSLALSVTVKVPVLVPVVVGSKKTPIEQLAPGATLLEHALSAPKSAGLAVTLVIVSVALPIFVSVTVCGRPEVPTYWLGKGTFDGDKLTPEPLPKLVKAAVCGLPGALSVTLSEALAFPNAVGVKVTVMGQLPPGGREVPQVLVWANSAPFGPAIPIEEMLRAVFQFPVLTSVTF